MAGGLPSLQSFSWLFTRTSDRIGTCEVRAAIKAVPELGRWLTGCATRWNSFLRRVYRSVARSSEQFPSEVGFRAARAAREVPNAAEERTLTFVLERPEMWVRKVGAR